MPQFSSYQLEQHTLALTAPVTHRSLLQWSSGFAQHLWSLDCCHGFQVPDSQMSSNGLCCVIHNILMSSFDCAVIATVGVGVKGGHIDYRSKIQFRKWEWGKMKKDKRENEENFRGKFDFEAKRSNCCDNSALHTEQWEGLSEFLKLSGIMRQSFSATIFDNILITEQKTATCQSTLLWRTWRWIIWCRYSLSSKVILHSPHF